MIFVHALAVTFAPGHDRRALGGAVTQALCGHWDHEGPCRWPHRTETSAELGDALEARVVFSCEAAEEPEVRTRIVEAARRGWLDGPDGRSEWTLEHEGTASATAEELASPPTNDGSG